MANRRRFLQGSLTGIGAALASFGINPALAQEVGKVAGNRIGLAAHVRKNGAERNRGTRVLDVN